MLKYDVDTEDHLSSWLLLSKVMIMRGRGIIAS